MTERVLSGLALVAMGLFALPAFAVEFTESGPFDTDFGLQRELPAAFGTGEFSLEVRFWADNTYPIGPTRPENTRQQRKNWAEEDHEPYSRLEWWYEGNFLLDGHNNDHYEQGTFSLQLYGGGRLRWLFGDGAADIQQYCWSAGAYPASSAPSLLDGQWHWVTAVRRWNDAGGADLELWIDGSPIAMEHTSARTDLWTYWKDWKAFYPDETGWYWGSERQASVGKLDQYEDFKGKISEIRFWSVALPAEQLFLRRTENEVDPTSPGLVGLYRLPEKFDGKTCNEITGGECIEYVHADERWTTTPIHHGAVEWGLIAAFVVAGTAALVLGAARAESVGERRIWMAATAVMYVSALSTGLNLPVLVGQSGRLAAQYMGVYLVRKPLQVAAIVAVCGFVAWTASRARPLRKELSREAKWAAVATAIATLVLLVRWSSWHPTDALLRTGAGELTLGWALELGAAVAVIVSALRRHRQQALADETD